MSTSGRIRRLSKRSTVRDEVKKRQSSLNMPKLPVKENCRECP